MTGSRIIALLIMAAAALNIFTGIRCGLPSEERLEIELGGRQYLDSQRGMLVKMLDGAYAVRQTNEAGQDDIRAELSPFADMVRTYHSDEQFTLKTISRMVTARDPEPHFYVYGQFYHYVTAVAPAVAAVTGYIPFSLSQEKLIMNPELGGRLFLACRILHGLFALAGVAALGLAVYRISGSRETALAAMAILALSPMYSIWAKIIKPDIVMCFFLTASLYFAAGLLQGDKWKDYIGLGICFGLATGCKYVAPLYGIVPLGFILCRHFGSTPRCKWIAALRSSCLKISILRLSAAAVTALLVFTVFNFGWLTDRQIFWQDVLGVSGLVTSSRPLYLRIGEYLAAFVFDGIFFHTGIAGVIFMVWIMTFGVRKFDGRWRFIWLAVWGFVILAGAATAPQSDQYLLPAVPLVSALLAVWICSSGGRYLRNACLVLLLLSSAWYSAALDIHAAGENERLTAARKLSGILPENSIIGRPLYPVSYRTVMLPPAKFRSVYGNGNADYFIECSYQFSTPRPALSCRREWLCGRSGEAGNTVYAAANTPYTLAKLLKSPRRFTMNSALEMIAPQFTVCRR